MIESNPEKWYPGPPAINPVQGVYPFCVVWTPIPFLSWMIPIIGHIGICDSQGRVYDFQGDFSIGSGHMLFGSPVKYWDVSKIFVPSFYKNIAADDDVEVRKSLIDGEVAMYDTAVANAVARFRRGERYRFFTNNCHSFVAAGLNGQHLSPGTFDIVTVCFAMMRHGKYVSTSLFFLAHGPFFLFLIILLLLVSLAM